LHCYIRCGDDSRDDAFRVSDQYTFMPQDEFDRLEHGATSSDLVVLFDALIHALTWASECQLPADGSPAQHALDVSVTKHHRKLGKITSHHHCDCVADGRIGWNRQRLPGRGGKTRHPMLVVAYSQICRLFDVHDRSLVHLILDPTNSRLLPGTTRSI
jgi:hypothetical protein